jgi:hypothetical protein
MPILVAATHRVSKAFSTVLAVKHDRNLQPVGEFLREGTANAPPQPDFEAFRAIERIDDEVVLFNVAEDKPLGSIKTTSSCSLTSRSVAPSCLKGTKL